MLLAKRNAPQAGFSLLEIGNLQAGLLIVVLFAILERE
jgi:hypothetical protein